MPWWIEEWRPADHAAMRALLGALKQGKPRGWSVVIGQNELVLRPADRGLGRFGITRSGSNLLRIAFHDRALNHWNGSHQVPADDPNAAAALLSWAREAAAAASPIAAEG
jgi:hypothetical protein